MTDEELKHIFSCHDIERNGILSFSEFKMILLSADQPSINLGISALNNDSLLSGRGQRIRRLESADHGLGSNDLQQAQRINGQSPIRGGGCIDLAALEGERGSQNSNAPASQNTRNPN